MKILEQKAVYISLSRLVLFAVLIWGPAELAQAQGPSGGPEGDFFGERGGGRGFRGGRGGRGDRDGGSGERGRSRFGDPGAGGMPFGGRGSFGDRDARGNDSVESVPARKIVTLKQKERVTVDLPESFSAGDANHDGQIGLYEWRRWKPAELDGFQTLDTDGDGFLTPKELVRAGQGPVRAVAASSASSGLIGSRSLVSRTTEATASQ